MTYNVRTDPPSDAAQAIITTWPDAADDAWHTEVELAEHLAGHGVGDLAPDGYRVGKRRLSGVLNEARRRGWVIRDQRLEPTGYRRSASGKAYARSRAAMREHRQGAAR